MFKVHQTIIILSHAGLMKRKRLEGGREVKQKKKKLQQPRQLVETDIELVTNESNKINTYEEGFKRQLTKLKTDKRL